MGIETGTLALMAAGGSGAGASLFGASQASSAAEDAASAVGDYQGTMTKIAMDQWGHWLSDYAPLEKKVLHAAQAGIDPNQLAQEAVADVATQYNKQRGVMTRNAQRLGIGGQGLQRDLGRLSELQAAAEAGAKTSGRRAARDINFQRRLTMLGFGKGLQGAASAGIQSAGNIGMGLAQMAQQRSDAASAAAGSAIGGLANMMQYGNWGSSGGGGGGGGTGVVTGTGQDWGDYITSGIID